MTEDLESTPELYFVVRNHELQYSIWQANREVPAGWTTVGSPKTRDECLDRIEEIWTDMRPLSLRLALGEEVDLENLPQ